MTPEKRKELLIYAANNPEARFTYEASDENYDAPIKVVLAYPEYDWEIVKFL